MLKSHIHTFLPLSNGSHDFFDIEWQFNTRSCQLVSAIIICGILVGYIVFQKQESKLQCVGDSCIPFLAKLRSAMNFRALLEEANRKYLSRGKMCRIPDFSFGPLVVLPSSQTRWFRSQPNRILHPSKAQHEVAQMKYLSWFSKNPFQTPLQGRYPRQWMNMRYESAKLDLHHEVSEGLKLSWGDNTKEWTEIPMYQSIIPVMTRAVWEALIGAPWCQDPDVIRYAQRSADLVFPFAQVIRAFPRFLQPIVASVVRLPLVYLYGKLRRLLRPIIEQRIKELKDANVDGHEKPSNDFMSWLLYRDIKEGLIDEDTVDKISSQLVGLTFAASQSVSITASNALWFLLCANPDENHLETAQLEIEQLSKEWEGKWTKQSLEKAVFLNAAIRETMRMLPGTLVASVRLLECDLYLPTTFHERGLNDGLQVLLKRGTKLGLPSLSIHNDPFIYPHPELFNPYRHISTDHEEGDGKIKSPSLTTISDDWLAWGLGKGACPGRWYANDSMKLLLIEMISKYSVKSVGDFIAEDIATKAPSLGPFKFPNFKAKILVKRKSNLEQTESEL